MSKICQGDFRICEIVMRQCQKYAIWDVTSSTWGSGGSCDKSCSHLRRLENSPTWRSPFFHPRSRRWRWTCRRRGGGPPSHRSAVSFSPAQRHPQLDKEHLEKDNKINILPPQVLKDILSTLRRAMRRAGSILKGHWDKDRALQRGWSLFDRGHLHCSAEVKALTKRSPQNRKIVHDIWKRILKSLDFHFFFYKFKSFLPQFLPSHFSLFYFLFYTEFPINVKYENAVNAPDYSQV